MDDVADGGGCACGIDAQWGGIACWEKRRKHILKLCASFAFRKAWERKYFPMRI